MDDFRTQSIIASLSLEEANNLIMNRARQFVNQLIDKRGNDRPPFLPEEYASLRGIKEIVREDLGKVSGMLLRFPDGYVIKVNNKHNLARQNFSCAHEIDHDLLRELKITLNTETEANRRNAASMTFSNFFLFIERNSCRDLKRTTLHNPLRFRVSSYLC